MATDSLGNHMFEKGKPQSLHIAARHVPLELHLDEAVEVGLAVVPCNLGSYSLQD